MIFLCITLKVMEKKWTKFPRFITKYINGLDSFLGFAYTRGRPQGREILCPCVKCKNYICARLRVVYYHLIVSGFLKGYDLWVYHGEETPLPTSKDEDMIHNEDSHDDINALLYDIFRNVVKAKEGVESPKDKARKFYQLINDPN